MNTAAFKTLKGARGRDQPTLGKLPGPSKDIWSPLVDGKELGPLHEACLDVELLETGDGALAHHMLVVVGNDCFNLALLTGAFP